MGFLLDLALGLVSDATPKPTPDPYEKNELSPNLGSDQNSISTTPYEINEFNERNVPDALFSTKEVEAFTKEVEAEEIPGTYFVKRNLEEGQKTPSQRILSLNSFFSLPVAGKNEFPTTPRPLERLLENLKAVHAQLEYDQAQGFTVETIDLGRSSKVQIQGRNYQALERAVRQAQERTPDAERVIVCAILPDGWEVTCAQYHDGTNAKRVKA